MSKRLNNFVTGKDDLKQYSSDQISCSGEEEGQMMMDSSESHIFTSSNDDVECNESVDTSNKPSNKQRRKTFNPRKIYSIVDKKNGFPTASVEYPPLAEVSINDDGLDEFIRSSRSLPFDKYDCSLCKLTFVTRSEMHDHLKNVHNINRSKSEGNNYLWCKVCLQLFDDQPSYDGHNKIHQVL